MEEKKIKKTSKGVIVFIIIISSIFVLGLGGIFIYAMTQIDSGLYTKFDYNISGDVIINNKVSITNVSDNKIGSDYYLQGYLENTSNKDYGYVEVEYSLYDKDGILLDRVSSAITDLKKNTKWKFIMTYPYSFDVVRYELTKVNFY